MLRNKKSLVKVVLMGLLTSSNVIWGGTLVHAEEPNQAFTLDPMVVTAQREEKGMLILQHRLQFLLSSNW